MKRIIESFRNVIPFREITIATSLSPSEITEIMKPRVAPLNFVLPFRRLAGNPDFIGKVTKNKIWLIPVVKGRFMYLPYTRGTIFTDEQGSCILSLTQSPHPYEISLFLLLGFYAIYEGVPDFIIVMGILHILCCLFIFLPTARRVEFFLNDKLKRQRVNA